MHTLPQHNEICELPVLNPGGRRECARVALRCGDCSLFPRQAFFSELPRRRLPPDWTGWRACAISSLSPDWLSLLVLFVHPLSWAQQQSHDGHAGMAMPIDQRKEGMLVVLGVVLAAYVE